ncbi:MAG: hypothetical protein ACO1ON_06500 [Nocardioides sp.]
MGTATVTGPATGPAARSTAARSTAAATVLALVLAVLAALGAVTVAAPAAAAATQGRIVGEVFAPGAGKIKIRVFDKNWTFLRTGSVRNGIYSVPLPAGTYYLQFTDERPAYIVDKYAPTDLKVTVRADRRTQKNVRMKPGAAITGTVRAGGRPLGGAEIVAANKNEQSFRVKANGQGQFALGGLPDGSYSVFTYDRSGAWVDKSTFLRGLRSGDRRNTAITLRKKGGRLLVELRAGGQRVRETVFVTAVSKASGQFWTVRARGGEASFKGLYPGAYTMVAPGVGNYLPQDAAIKGARVKSGRADLASVFTWTKRGATVSGFVIDGEYPQASLQGVSVLLFAADGTRLGTTETRSDGSFTVGGQVYTQDGVTVKLQPGGFNAPYLQGQFYCKFGTLTLEPLAVTEGQDLPLGDLALPQLPTAEQDNKSNCGPDHTAP